MRFKYPYTAYRGLYLPIIPLEILGQKEWHTVWAFVDSGATYSLFGIDVAQRLGLDWKRGEKIHVVVGDGALLETYLHVLEIRLARHVLKASIGFSEKLKVGFNLLGRKDIFTCFTVCFSDRFKQVTFSKIP